MTALRVIALVGATATGKTAVAEALAPRLDGEIVCADSRQVFRELEIGTGKPDRAERAAWPHHLFEALALDERPSAGWYARVAADACRAIHARGRLPILVGGSGLYLKALAQGLAEEPPRVAELRAQIMEELAALGPAALHARLATVDPETALRLAPRDRQRIVRALEVHGASGKPLSWWHARPHVPGLDASWRVAELVVEPRILAERIATRTQAMLAQGLIDETRALQAAGREKALRQLRAVGYDEALDHLAGAIDRSEAAARIDLRTRQLAKRQRTWFRHQIEAERIEATEMGAEELAQRVLASVR